MNVRKATHDDVPAIITLFQQTVRIVTARDYTGPQRHVWASRGEDMIRWKSKIDTQHFLVAEQQDQLLGFGSITAGGHLDMLFVHQAHQRNGIATILLGALERWATHQSVNYVTTDASLTARPFFAHHGYSLIRKQKNVIEDEVLVNYRMQKVLSPL